MVNSEQQYIVSENIRKEIGLNKLINKFSELQRYLQDINEK